MRQHMAKTRDPEVEIVRKNLVEFRKRAGLTQDDAAQFSGVPVDNLRRYERGDSGVSADALRKLAVIYGHAMDHFYMEKPPAPDLAGRPAIHLKALPGQDLDEAEYKRIQGIVERANREMASKRKR